MTAGKWMSSWMQCKGNGNAEMPHAIPTTDAAHQTAQEIPTLRGMQTRSVGAQSMYNNLNNGHHAYQDESLGDPKRGAHQVAFPFSDADSV